MTQDPVQEGLWKEREAVPTPPTAPPSDSGELKQSVYHGKTALCSNSNGNFPE